MADPAAERLAQRAPALQYLHDGDPSKASYHLVKAFKNVLAGITSPDEGAKRLESVVMSQGNRFWDTYETVIVHITNGASELTSDIVLQRLAALTAALTRLPDAKNNGNETLTWKDNLGVQGKAEPGVAIIHNELSREDVCRQWSNVNAFLAHLTKHSRGHNDALDYYMYAILTLRVTLEEGDTNGNNSSLETRMHTPAAAQWIRIMGPELHRGTKVFRANDRHMVGGGMLYNDHKYGYGFSPQRWALWRDRFWQFAGDMALDGETREVAADAAKAMR
ncbi:hypothetical protein SLS56_008339 [Neofusicoccum ribis]|uniref:Uncharacterized protein n=1 Tax=Neofusicoccum ribis TaxID=45134 RepID=A0ABR3SL74_9PEZI